MMIIKKINNNNKEINNNNNRCVNSVLPLKDPGVSPSTDP